MRHRQVSGSRGNCNRSRRTDAVVTKPTSAHLADFQRSAVDDAYCTHAGAGGNGGQGIGGIAQGFAAPSQQCQSVAPSTDRPAERKRPGTTQAAVRSERYSARRRGGRCTGVYQSPRRRTCTQRQCIGNRLAVEVHTPPAHRDRGCTKRTVGNRAGARSASSQDASVDGCAPAIGVCTAQSQRAATGFDQGTRSGNGAGKRLRSSGRIFKPCGAGNADRTAIAPIAEDATARQLQSACTDGGAAAVAVGTGEHQGGSAGVFAQGAQARNSAGQGLGGARRILQYSGARDADGAVVVTAPQAASPRNLQLTCVHTCRTGVGVDPRQGQRAAARLCQRAAARCHARKSCRSAGVATGQRKATVQYDATGPCNRAHCVVCRYLVGALRGHTDRCGVVQTTGDSQRTRVDARCTCIRVGSSQRGGAPAAVVDCAIATDGNRKADAVRTVKRQHGIVDNAAADAAHSTARAYLQGACTDGGAAAVGTCAGEHQGGSAVFEQTARARDHSRQRLRGARGVLQHRRSGNRDVVSVGSCPQAPKAIDF